MFNKTMTKTFENGNDKEYGVPTSVTLNSSIGGGKAAINHPVSNTIKSDSSLFNLNLNMNK